MCEAKEIMNVYYLIISALRLPTVLQFLKSTPPRREGLILATGRNTPLYYRTLLIHEEHTVSKSIYFARYESGQVLEQKLNFRWDSSRGRFRFCSYAIQVIDHSSTIAL